MWRRQLSKGNREIVAMTFEVTPTLMHAPLWAETFAKILARHGIETTPEKLQHVVPIVRQELECLADPRSDRYSRHPGGKDGWWHHFVSRVSQHLESPPATRFTTAELLDHFARADAWEVYPEVRPFLERLAASPLRVGIVSNWDHRLTKILEELDLLHFFDDVTYSAACGVEKPHPLIFEECLARLRVRPHSALHVGSRRLEDLEGAQGAGLQAVLVDRRRQDAETLSSLEPLLELCPSPPATPSPRPHFNTPALPPTT